MHITPNAKFAAFFLSRCEVKQDLPQEDERIETSVWVSQRLSVDVAEHWREWLGSLTVDEMKEGGLAVYVTAPSQNPEVLDAENNALVQQINVAPPPGPARPAARPTDRGSHRNGGPRRDARSLCAYLAFAFYGMDQNRQSVTGM